MKKYLLWLTVISAVTFSPSGLKAASTTAVQDVTTSEIIDALVSDQWKWSVTIGGQAEKATLELVELTYKDGVAAERSLIGGGGWFAATGPALANRKNVPLIVLRLAGSNKMYLKLGFVSGLYDLPADFQWPGNSILRGVWRGRYLILIDD